LQIFNQIVNVTGSMPNPWTGKGNPYTREEVRERLAIVAVTDGAVHGAGRGVRDAARDLAATAAEFGGGIHEV
jgi:hypothetical protein